MVNLSPRFLNALHMYSEKLRLAKSDDHRQQVAALVVNKPSNQISDNFLDTYPVSMFILSEGTNSVATSPKHIDGLNNNSREQLKNKVVCLTTNKTAPYVLHAEEMAMLNLLRSGLYNREYVGKLKLFVSHCPCVRCMARIIQSGLFDEVIYVYSHDNNESIVFAKELAPTLKITEFSPGPSNGE